MKRVLIGIMLGTVAAFGHTDVENMDREELRAHLLAEWKAKLAPKEAPQGEARPVQVASGAGTLHIAAAAAANAANAPLAARPFLAFPKLEVKWDGDYLFVGSNGWPDHPMMVGITNWQQQVPLPQAYFGANAWRIPLKPVPARTPAMIEGRFLRGAVAVAVNGVPIFNPQNNRGEVSAEIGELDQWGGHCGRADDYHYHAAPLHLQTVVGKGMPIAYALDGYPIYGLSEPDGSPVGKLDECHGHERPGIGYHYHAAVKRPYVMAGFHGEVVEVEGQVDPQPRTQGVRPALEPLRGAKITRFEGEGRDGYTLEYALEGRKRAIRYQIRGDEYHFEYEDGRGEVVKEVYSARGGGERPKGKGRPREGGPRPQAGGPAPAPPPQGGGDGRFVLTSPVVEDGGEMPVDFTGDGRGVTLPLEWKGAPMGTRAYALIMDHQTPDGDTKWYWTLYDLPAAATRLPADVQGVGKVGTGFKGRVGYEPPHSKGPGAKTYVLTVYALSENLRIAQSPNQVNRDVLLTAMEGKVLASAALRVVHTSGARAETNQPPPRPPEARTKGKGAGQAGLVKPGLTDTMKLNVYADNWFMLYVNGRLVAVDPIQFTPHNVVSVDFLPEYPMTIAVLAKDNADPRTGMEYGTSIGDGGFALKFGDGTVTNGTWKAKSFFHGPIRGDTARPTVRQQALPPNWWAVEFDDGAWANAKEYSVEEVDPKEPYFGADFSGAKFIWTDDLALDNTVIFRARIEKPEGWTQRWNTKPDLDVTGVPLR